MNSLYASFLEGIRARRSVSGSRDSLMDKVLDQVESEKVAPGMTYSDTSASIITAFVQAMMANQDVQRKAQAEIDSVLGAERSPTWKDYADLPYVGMCSAGNIAQEIRDPQLTCAPHLPQPNASKKPCAGDPSHLWHFPTL
jgi:hypothetical protein